MVWGQHLAAARCSNEFPTNKNRSLFPVGWGMQPNAVCSANIDIALLHSPCLCSWHRLCAAFSIGIYMTCPSLLGHVPLYGLCFSRMEYICATCRQSFHAALQKLCCFETGSSRPWWKLCRETLRKHLRVCQWMFDHSECKLSLNCYKTHFWEQAWKKRYCLSLQCVFCGWCRKPQASPCLSSLHWELDPN